MWYPEPDSNRHILRYQFLRLARLPLRHLGIFNVTKLSSLILAIIYQIYRGQHLIAGITSYLCVVSIEDHEEEAVVVIDTLYFLHPWLYLSNNILKNVLFFVIVLIYPIKPYAVSELSHNFEVHPHS